MARRDSIDSRGVSPWMTAFIVALVASLGFFALERALAVRTAWTQRQHKARPLSDAVDGPIVLRGKLMAPAGRVAPTGQSAAVWYFEVIKKDRDFDEPVCRLTDASGLWLGAGDAKVPLRIPQVAGVQDASVVRSWLAREPVGSELSVPLAVLAECRLGDCKEMRRYGGTPFDPSCADVYFGREVVIPPDTEVTVVGCRAFGQVTGCGDGLDLLSSRGIGLVGKPSTWAGVLQLVLVVLVGLFGAALLGGSELRTLVGLLQPERNKG